MPKNYFYEHHQAFWRYFEQCREFWKSKCVGGASRYATNVWVEPQDTQFEAVIKGEGGLRFWEHEGNT